MTEAHWFSNYCPFFSVFDLDKFLLAHGPVARVTPENLKSASHSRGCRWLVRDFSLWEKYLARAQEAIRRSRCGEFQIIFWNETCYPENLKNLAFPPSVLFVKGDKKILHDKTVSIVGARQPTDLGRLWVKDVVKELVPQGITVVSGGARGIDAEAHFATLANGGKTIAFLPGGVDRPYPATNSYIFEKMEKTGALVSEFLPGTQVRAENFYRRNRLIAGLSHTIVIVEAGLKSGTMMTATKALAENREVLVVPGPPMLESYAGSLELLTQGAGLARNAKDVIKSILKENF